MGRDLAAMERLSVVGLLLGLAQLCSAEDGALPDPSRVSYQTAFPKTGPMRMPGFMDVFASLSQSEYVNIGMKWNVAESKAAMAYATRLSSGHAPIVAKTDDYHIEAFSKADRPAPADFTKI